MTYIELLAPAKDMQTGREAILHGADAVYIGAPRYGARAAAGNSVEDILELVRFAHLYGVKVYVTLNTILYDEEVEEARNLARELWKGGVDAFIVQDLSLLHLKDEGIALHASTQMDNRSAEKLQWLWNQGVRQAVLARELTLEEIAEVHRKVPRMALEAFVHGATCVCYNGQCYASQYCFGRSANRGECAQFCRLPFDLIDAEGKELLHQRHLLSLHDMNRSEELEAMLDAGVVSLKIEGRLKDAGYVKNVTAYYRQRLDEIMRRRPDDYRRSSYGNSAISFVPNVARSFNRGFSNYFLHGRTPDLVQLSTPKSMGEKVGHVKEVRRNCFTVSGVAAFCNGDGICFLDENGHLQGFRVNRVEGNCLYPKEMPRGLHPRTVLYRNYDQDFEQLLSRPTATRRIAVDWEMSVQEGGFRLKLTSEDGRSLTRTFDYELQPARSAQQEAIRRQLERLGDTIYEARSISVNVRRGDADQFVPASVLASWRREMVERMNEERLQQYRGNEACLQQYRGNDVCLQQYRGNEMRQHDDETPSAMLDALRDKQKEAGHLTYLANVANEEARHFCMKQGAREVDDALELCLHKSRSVPSRDAQKQGLVLMTTRYCIRYELGMCPRHHGAKAAQLSLRSADGSLFPLFFDCKNCQMQVRV